MPVDRRTCLFAPALLLFAGLSAAAGEAPLRYEPETESLAAPVKLAMLQPGPQDESVYAPPAPPSDAEGANTGGINLDLSIRYLTDYLYRGVDRTRFIGAATGDDIEEKANFQFEGQLTFNLGKFPHPFIGVFANVLDEDPVQTFQEVRPVFGAQLYVRPFIFAAGNNTYIFPDRSELNTAEAWARITLDDAAIFRRDEPIFSPYVYAAYDYDNYDGWYLEAGISHTVVIENTGITLTFQGAVAAVLEHPGFIGRGLTEDDEDAEDTGIQHWEAGVIGRYSLNQLLNIPQRFGNWSFNGYLFYADGIDKDLRADTQLWGGAGIQLTY